MERALSDEPAGELRRALVQHWPEYLIEAGGLGLFMVSATAFTALLEHPASWVHQSIDNETLRRFLIGLAMGLTAIAIIYSPWGKRSGAHINPAATFTFYRLGKIAPWDAFFSRRNAVGLLALIVLYKLGDAFAGSLSTTFLIRGVGFTATEVGAVNKVLGLVATIVGALMGGVWLAKRPLFGALMLFGVLQAVSNFGYWLLAVLPKNYPLMTAAIGLENLCGGLGTAAFVAFLMTLTDKRFSAAQFALLSALAAVGRVYVGPASGVMVEAFGWPSFFLLTVVAALPGLLLLALLRRTIEHLASATPAEPPPAAAGPPAPPPHTPKEVS